MSAQVLCNMFDIGEGEQLRIHHINALLTSSFGCSPDGHSESQVWALRRRTSSLSDGSILGSWSLDACVRGVGLSARQTATITREAT